MLPLSHKRLDVYQNAMLLVKEVYRVTDKFPPGELFSLTRQLRKSAISVCSNIAEGASRFTRQEKKRFFEISRSSLVELDCQLEIASTLEFLVKEQTPELHRLIPLVFSQLSGLIKSLGRTVSD